MSSNIEFKSNVYPFLKSMQLDKIYLSKIYNYERLVDFNNRYFKLNSKDIWNKLQLEIISLSPACSIDTFKDPCRGLIKEKDNFEFVCKCVNTSCKNFNICRSSFDQTEYDLFSPVVNTFDENLYGYNKQKYEMYPVFHLIREIVIDNSVIKINTPIEKEYENQVKYEDDTIIDAFKIIDKSETDESKSLGIEESESTETGNVELETETDINNDINDTKTAKTTPDTLENIFDSFTSADQQDIINASPSEVIFVNAGPGTGKTYTLIQKLIYMVTEYEVDPESIMVLCFTNAAVDEIRYRLNVVVSNSGHRGLMNVDIRTFHSFAWWLIGQANESFLDDGWTEVNMHSLNFDKSISVASKVISKFSTRIFDGWQHFIVDEVQDLTNNLARFVLRIINSCLNKGCGVTALGDSCQAIYDYTQMENVNPMTSEEFYTTLYRNIKHKARFLKLSVNHRQTNDLKELATKYRGSILSANISNMASEVSSLSQDIEYIEKTPIDINEKDLEELCKLGKLSILLRNNVQTLKLSSVFRKRGINHILKVN
ncbi:MAG: AAA family ATPase [Prolixibacteraceae bacterium]|nr:AAA family ATPase [Prolixibacteraceae bacterium]